jgi:death-on-curing protein
MTTYLTLTQALALHDKALKSSPGQTSGVADLGVLYSALARPEAHFEGLEIYPRLERKGAALFLSLIESKPFKTGNKRTAALVLMTFLRLNGCELKANPGELAALALAAETKRASEEVIATWIVTRRQA